MSQTYMVVGGCEVGGVPNGGEVEHDHLVALGANVDALLYGGHIAEKPTRRRRKAGDDADGEVSG